MGTYYAVGKDDLPFVLYGVYQDLETAKLWQDFNQEYNMDISDDCIVQKVTINTDTPEEAKDILLRLRKKEEKERKRRQRYNYGYGER